MKLPLSCARIHALRVTVAVAVLVVAASAEDASAQVIVYQDPQPMVTAPPLETYGVLTGRNAFYGRVSVGLGGDVFGITDSDGSSFSLTSGVAGHVDFSVGLRFAFTHALTLDFDFDRGFSPSLEGTSLDGATMYTGAFGASYTNFVRGSGLYLGGGLGLGISWFEFEDSSGGSLATSPTGLGYSLHVRGGYDWTLGVRTHVGAALTLRYLGLVDEDDAAWRGVAIAASASFGWY